MNASLFDYGENVAHIDDDKFFAVDLDFRSGVFGNDNFVADFDFDAERVFRSVVRRSVADCDDLSHLRLLFCG